MYPAISGLKLTAGKMYQKKLHKKFNFQLSYLSLSLLTSPSTSVSEASELEDLGLADAELFAEPSLRSEMFSALLNGALSQRSRWLGSDSGSLEDCWKMNDRFE